MLVTNVTHSVVNFIHFILEIPFLTTFHPTQFMRFSNTSFRFRIALVLVAVGGLSALLMGLFGFRIMRMELEESAKGWAQDVACALVDVLERDGITIEKLQNNPQLIAQLQMNLARADKDLASHTIDKVLDTPSIWSNLIIAVPEGDQWRIVARQDPKDSIYMQDNKLEANAPLKEKTYTAIGSLMRVEPADEDTAPISVTSRSSGWYKTSRATMFGAV